MVTGESLEFEADLLELSEHSGSLSWLTLDAQGRGDLNFFGKLLISCVSGSFRVLCSEKERSPVLGRRPCPALQSFKRNARLYFDLGMKLTI